MAEVMLSNDRYRTRKSKPVNLLMRLMGGEGGRIWINAWKKQNFSFIKYVSVLLHFNPMNYLLK